jgi:3-isopropylmalate/(R)-2-methylmalate dehydratase small subunit
MNFEPFRKLSSRTIVLPQDNIDTDQIIPARFLTTTSRDGLGRAAFYDWRFDENDRPLNSSLFAGLDPAQFRILVGGSNFGCGSSREHAAWALYGYGFRAVISSDIADIFKSNALKNGILPVEVGAEFHACLIAHPGAEVVIDLEREVVGVLGGGLSEGFAIEPFARRCLLEGVDPLGHLLSRGDAISRFEASRG